MLKPPPSTSAPGSERLARVFKALADEGRIEILRLIAAQGQPVCACDLVGHVDLSQPTISHHLKILREAGLLSGTRSGIWNIYTVAPCAEELLALADRAVSHRSE